MTVNQMTKPNLLLTPGPTQVPSDVLQVMAEPIFHHRTPQYRALFKSVSEDLKVVFRTKHTVYTFTGSGTLAMEAAVVNFCSPGEQVLVLEAGKFGERWRSIAEFYGLQVIALKASYGDVVTPKEVAGALRTHPRVSAVYATLCETSTGALFDIEAMAQVVSRTKAILVVDAISGLAADRLEMDGWVVDVVVSGSQKGFMLPPGLSFLAASEKAKILSRHAKCPRFYVDLAKYDRALESQDTPFTPAISLVCGLREVLNRIQKVGMEKIWSETAQLARKTRDQVQKLGLELFTTRPANAVTAVKVPHGVDGNRLVSLMRDEKGVTMAGGQGEMKGKVFRIAHFGCITAADIDHAISVLGETIEEMKR